MNNRLLFVIALMLCGQALMAQAPSQRGWFLGLETGPTDSNYNGDQLMGVFGGYQFNRFFSLELGHLELGDYRQDQSPEGGSIYDVSAKGTKIVGGLHWPLSEKFSLSGKLGIFDSHIETSVNNRNKKGHSDTGVAVEVGGIYHHNDRLALSLEYGSYHFDSLGVWRGDFNIGLGSYHQDLNSVKTVKLAARWKF